MHLDPVLRAASGNTADARRIRAIPTQLSGKIPLTPLAEQLVRALDECVAGALCCESPEAFSAYLGQHIPNFVILAIALSTQNQHVRELPRTCGAAWLVDLLGNGADVELEFCESTLWSCVSRAVTLDQRPPPVSDPATASIHARFVGNFFVGIFCWTVVQRSATASRPQPVAVGSALTVLREAALNAAVALSEAEALVPQSELEFPHPSFDAEDMLLARSP